MRTAEIKIYKFNELDKNIQDDVICKYIDEIIQTTDFENLHKNSKLYKAFKKANEMQTPWFLGNYIWESCEDEILKALKKCEYYENGDIYNG